MKFFLLSRVEFRRWQHAFCSGGTIGTFCVLQRAGGFPTMNLTDLCCSKTRKNSTYIGPSV
jgi:hypothetical protein